MFDEFVLLDRRFGCAMHPSIPIPPHPGRTESSESCLPPWRQYRRSHPTQHSSRGPMSGFAGRIFCKAYTSRQAAQMRSHGIEESWHFQGTGKVVEDILRAAHKRSAAHPDRPTRQSQPWGSDPDDVQCSKPDIEFGVWLPIASRCELRSCAVKLRRDERRQGVRFQRSPSSCR